MLNIVLFLLTFFVPFAIIIFLNVPDFPFALNLHLTEAYGFLNLFLWVFSVMQFVLFLEYRQVVLIITPSLHHNDYFYIQFICLSIQSTNPIEHLSCTQYLPAIKEKEVNKIVSQW